MLKYKGEKLGVSLCECVQSLFYYVLHLQNRGVAKKRSSACEEEKGSVVAVRRKPRARVCIRVEIGCTAKMPLYCYTLSYIVVGLSLYNFILLPLQMQMGTTTREK